MTPIKRPLAAAGAAALLALSLSACGGAPADASVEDFCKVTQDEAGQEDFVKAIQDEDWDKIEELIKDQADEVEEVGTPDDISDEAREGFEIQLDAAKGISADDLEKAFKDDEDPFEADLSSDDKKKVEAYTEYENKTCDDSGDGIEPEGGTDPEVSTPTELPTDDLPTDLPTDGIPTDLPTELSPEDLESLQSELEKLTESAATE
ncbi:MAG TPA: hypothetical protein VM575_17525 [Nocardioides sp.]|nr:hypothetical protein [Nocardioides sp.]